MCTFPGKPEPLQRHRHGRHKVYNPQEREMTAFANYFKEHYEKQLYTDGMSGPLTCPLRVDFLFYFEPAQSLSEKKKKSMYGTPHTQKPDTSNLIKFVEDSLNGYAYFDDRQISHGSFLKEWAQEAKTVVIIQEIASNVKKIEK